MKLVCFVAALLCAGSVSAAPPPCGERPIKLAFFEYGLYFFHGKGIDKDLADALQRRSGCNFDLQVQARARTWHDLKSGQLDMAFSALWTPERDAFGWFEPYLWVKNMAVVQRDVARQVEDAAGFLEHRRLVMGVVRGFKHGEEQDRWIDQLRREDRVVEYVDADQLFRNLAAHHVDAVIADLLVYRRLLSPAELEAVTIEDWTPAERGAPVSVIWSKARFAKAEADAWRELVRDMIADGTVHAILRRYLPAEDVEKIERP